MAFTTVRALYYSPDHWVDHSIFRSSTAYMTVCPPHCLADGSGLLILSIVNGFHDGLRAVFLSGWWRIAHSFSCQRLSRRFARCIAQRIAADCSYFHSSTAFTTVRTLYCSADRSADRSIFRSSMAFTTDRALYYSADHSADHSIFHSSPAITTVCPPYCSADGSTLLILPLVNGFHNGFHAVLLSRSLSGSCNLLLVILHGEWDYSSFVGSFISYAFR